MGIMSTNPAEMTTTELLICNHPGCYFELPADCFAADARNTRRFGRATRCYDCESARTRKGTQPRPGSHAARVAGLKASGLYQRHDPVKWAESRDEATEQRRLAGAREKARRKAAAYLPHRWTARIKIAQSEQRKYGSPSRRSMKLLNRWAPLLGQEIPTDLCESPV